ncbi:alkaline phosphatase family protein [Parapedomonas caeni]
MRIASFLTASLLVLAATGADAAPKIVMISIDGLRPADVLEADKRGIEVPNLKALVRDGASATGVRGVLPTVTYPSHTTLLTGTAPAAHGVVNNLTFDPARINQAGWYWYATDIKVETLWDAAEKAGRKTANVHWPVSVSANADLNLPQIWRTGHEDDRKLMAALATPGLLPALESHCGHYAQGIDESIEGDENRAKFGIRLIETEQPDFITLYWTALDHEQHQYGPGTPQAHAVLKRIDALVGQAVAAARKVDPGAIVAIVSDHGFAPLHTELNVPRAFVEAGLITLDDKGAVTAWEAMPWPSGGSGAVVLARPDDKALEEKVGALLARLAADPANGIAKIYDRAAMAAVGANPQASFYVAFKAGFAMGYDPTKPMLSPSKSKGTHGYAPDMPEMRATFIIAGAGVPKARSLGDIDMRDIAPTIAALGGLTLPTAEGRVLLGNR